MNKVTLIGRVTKDIDMRYTQSAEPMAVARFTLAVDRRNKEKETDFIQCIAFRKTAELMEKYVSKGNRIGVCGKIQTGSYTKQDGSKVYTTDVIVDEIDLLESKQEVKADPLPDFQPGMPQQGFAPQGMPQPQYQQQTFTPNYQSSTTPGFMQVGNNPEGLPFN